MAKSKHNIRARAEALLKYPTALEAYKSLNPNAADSTAKVGGCNWLKDPEVKAEMERILNRAKVPNINKEFVVGKYLMVLDKWERGEAKDGDFIKALENLQKLCPEFVDRKEMHRPLPEDELNRTLAEKMRRALETRVVPSEQAP